jgi:hypothetical protein
MSLVSRGAVILCDHPAVIVGGNSDTRSYDELMVTVILCRGCVTRREGR